MGNSCVIFAEVSEESVVARFSVTVPAVVRIYLDLLRARMEISQFQNPILLTYEFRSPGCRRVRLSLSISVPSRDAQHQFVEARKNRLSGERA